MRKWYAIVMGVLTLALAAALVLQAVDIYADGNAPGNVLGDGVYAVQVYRAEDIRARLEPLALPAAVWLMLAVGGAVFFPTAEDRGKTEKMRHVSPKRVPGLRIAVGALAVGLTALGIANGGMRDVLVKAINICTECIGLG